MDERVQIVYENNEISISRKEVSHKKATYFVDDIQGVEVKRDYFKNVDAVISTVGWTFLLLVIAFSDPWMNNGFLNFVFKGIVLLLVFAIFTGSLKKIYRKHAKVLFSVSGKKKKLGSDLDIEEANKIKQILTEIKIYN